MKRVLSLMLLLATLLLATSAFAGDVSFIIGYDFSKASSCATSTSVLCVQDFVIYDTLTGSRHVVYTLAAPATATTQTSLTTPFVTIKDAYGPVVYTAVARARDGAGNLIESDPFFAPSVILKPPTGTLGTK